MLLRPVEEFLIAAFTIDKVDINRTFIGENGGESGIAALVIGFAHEQRQAPTGIMGDTSCVAHINRQHVGHQALLGSINFTLEFELFLGAPVFLFNPELSVVTTLGVVADFNAEECK